MTTLAELAMRIGGRPKRGGHNGHEAIEGRCPACEIDGKDRKGDHLVAWADGEWLHFCRCVVGHTEEEILRALGWTQDDRRMVPKGESPTPARRPAPRDAEPVADPATEVPPDLASRPADHNQVWEYHDAKGRVVLSKRKEYVWKQPTPARRGRPGAPARWARSSANGAPTTTSPPRSVGGSSTGCPR